MGKRLVTGNQNGTVAIFNFEKLMPLFKLQMKTL